MMECHILLDKVDIADMISGQTYIINTWVITVFKTPSQTGKHKRPPSHSIGTSGPSVHIDILGLCEGPALPPLQR